MAKKSKSTVSLLDAPVQFGGVSIGDQTARLGVRISRQCIKLEHADEYFSGRRLSIQVALGGGEDSPGQMLLLDDMDFVIASVCDVKRYGVTSDTISTGLTFSLKDTEIETLARFSKGSGRLAINQAVEIPVDVATDDDDDDDAPKKGALKTDQPWRRVSLDTLFHGSILKALKAGGLSTVGDMADHTAKDNRLTDIRGIGGAAAEKIEDQMARFWADNPDAGKQMSDAVLGAK